VGENTIGYIGLTDYKWFSFLRVRPHLEEINFWKPSAQVGFKAIPQNAPFFFQLKRPHYAIAGFGYFVRYSKLPIWLAWDSFGEANGHPLTCSSGTTRRSSSDRPTARLIPRTASTRVVCRLLPPSISP